MQIIQDTLQSKRMPLVSFIITYYNLPIEWLKECIDSILALSLSTSEREVIVVDDGSSHNPMNDLAQYGNCITYIRQPNRGLSVARNTGMSISSGKYIQFVDGDDRLITNEYEHCLDIVRYDDPDMVLFNSTNNGFTKSKTSGIENTNGTAYMTNNNIRASAWGYVFKKKILMGLRFTPGLLHEDEEFTPQLLLRAENIYITEYTAYFYRRRQESITSNNDRKHILKRLNDFENIIYHLQDIANTLPAVDSIAMQRRIAQLTMDYIYNTITLTRSDNQLSTRLERLKKAGLYPLPDKKYSHKYTLFTKLANNKQGLALLKNILKIVKNK